MNLSTDPARDTIRLLGPITVRVANQEVHHFRSHKTLAILAYLIVENRWVARDHLATLFWPDVPLGEGRGHLRRALYDLLHKIPGCILVHSQIMTFNPAFRAMVDLTQIGHDVPYGDITGLEAVAVLCRGELMEGLDCSDCPKFDEWLMAEREIWRRKTAGILSNLIDQYTVGGRHPQALDFAWRLARLQPWREEHYRRLMILLTRTGDPAHALKVFKLCVRQLAEEMDLEPSAEMVALRDRVRQLLTKVPTNLVGPSPNVSGQAAHLAGIRRGLAQPACRVITITGPSGPDRNNLAIRAGMEGNGPDGYLFMDGVFLVRADDDAAAGSLAEAITRTLRFTSKPQDAPPGLLQHYLQNKELLLILADYDRRSYPPEEVAELLAAAPGVKLLITAGERLNLAGEQVIESRRQDLALVVAEEALPDVML